MLITKLRFKHLYRITHTQSTPHAYYLILMHNFRPDNHGIDYSRLQKYEFRRETVDPRLSE